MQTLAGPIDLTRLPGDYEVWTSGDVTLIRGDCERVIDAFRPARGDAVVTDPPYGIRHPCRFAARGRSRIAKCNNYPDVIGVELEPTYFATAKRRIVEAQAAVGR